MEKEFLKNIGDTVWFMYSNKAVCGKISGIKYSKITSPISYTIKESESYKVSVSDKDLGYYSQEKLFDTKDDLINSL